ncbi:MAG: 23S rRNA (pseudouridine(1915)-N(3))-methyltransferase RlmH [Desulfobulbus sp.]|jgi:23S rRNA (pseudouridine1915-N3)-methyltransferase|uniref:23S rRNA (pseudouridine(1915)-N(3))-methyltransferase RlmH n=1 Tax=Desulfobulbus sp. TaxID=895 RepID=UPI00284606F5|nr:23S rRNA (pseudouridine(1915)-N(3))-methyltransferase RlmH [Desulfobulbus sp.]MDR2551047.1 23S rRNA (pseudouridine(1915)-N(3))-methyltransferase RlmH [Desulfobulbus sp.]
MRFLIPLVGKTREPYLNAGIRDYANRLSHFVPVALPVLRERHGRREPDEAIKAAEAAPLLEQAAAAGLCVALDPGGMSPDSHELAGLLTQWEERGIGTVCFLIGGHLGLHRSVLARANVVMSLSRLTFTHEMTRLILLEQLYRACTIKAGQKYHK